MNKFLNQRLSNDIIERQNLTLLRVLSEDAGVVIENHWTDRLMRMGHCRHFV